MGKYLVYDLLILNTGNDLNRTTAMSAGFHINVKYPFQALCPGHGRPALIWRFALPTDFLLSFAPPCWCDLDPVFAVRCEYAVEAREIDPRFRH